MNDDNTETRGRGEQAENGSESADEPYGSISRRHFVGTGVATGAAALGVGSTAVSGQSDDEDEPTWFDTAQTEHPVDTFHYNTNEFAGTTHAEFGLFSQYAVYDWENAEFVPHLVEEWTTGETEMVLKLRDDVTWETGDPVDAESLLVQWDTYEQGGHPLFDVADGVEATGDYELTISYPEGTNTGIVEHAVLHEAADMAPADWADFEGENLIAHDVPEPTASGPLTLTAQESNYHQFEPRDRVEGVDDHPFASNYNFDGYRMRYREDNQALQQSFIDQELDGVHSLFAREAVLQRFPDSLEEITIPGTFGMGMWFNQQREPWSDRQVRQAVAHSLDLESVLASIGDTQKIHHPTQTGLAAATVEDWLGSWTPEGFEQYDDDDVDVFQLVEDAGYSIDEISMDFVVPAGWSDWVLMAGQIGDQLGQAGWDVDVNTLGGAYWSVRARDGDFDAIAVEHSDGPRHNEPYYSLRFKLYGRGGEPPYVAGYADGEDDVVEIDGEEIHVQDTFEALATTDDREEQEELVHTLAKVVNRDLPYIHVAQKYEQSFVDREFWNFPEEHELMRTQWPLWMLPKTEDSFPEYDQPGLLKSADGTDYEPVGIAVSLEGDRLPGTEVVVGVTADGEPAAEATVTVNGAVAGHTDADGELEIEVPSAGHQFDLRVAVGADEVTETYTIEQDSNRVDQWFDTAQMEHPVDTFHYNYNEWAGTTHAEFGLFSQYAHFDAVNAEFVPHLVEEWTVGDTEMVLTLREDVDWETGDPVDAESLLVQWDLYEQGGHELFDVADGVEATGDYELTVSYPEGTNTGIVEHAVLHEAADMAPADWEDFEGEALYDHDVPEPTASGPLTLTEQTDDYHQFEPRDAVVDAADHPFASNYNWNGYRMRHRENNQAAHQSFIEQELDGIHSLFAKEAVLQRFPDSLEEIQIPGTFGMGMWFNHLEEPWSNRQVRQAVAQSLDLESILLSLGDDKKIYHPTQTGLTAATVEDWLGSWTPEGFEQYDDDDVDVDEMVEDAGYSLREISMDFVVPAGWSDWILMAAQIGDQLGQTGWDVNVNTLGGEYWAVRTRDGDYDAIAVEHSDGPRHNEPYYSLRYKLYGRSGEPAHIAGYADGEEDVVEIDGEEIHVQDTFEELATTADRAEQEELVRTLSKVVNRDLPYIHVAQKYEQSFVDRESWNFPEDHQLLDVQWPMWVLPKTDESLETARSPGLLKAGSSVDCASVDDQTVCDLDGDGSYRDVNGDGSVTNSDVTDFFSNQHTPAWNDRVELFDFDGNDDVGQSDVVELFEYVTR